MQNNYLNKKFLLLLSTLIGLVGIVGVGHVQAQEKEASGAVLNVMQQTQKRVHDLLNKAVEHVRVKGVSAVNDFNKDPQFTDKELYVFSVSRSGVMLSSGGWSASLVGQNVLEVTDEQQQPFFQTMLNQAKVSDSGRVQYLWFNPADGLNDPKITYFKVVDNIIIAVGFFPKFSTEEQAKALLELAVKEYMKDPDSALRKFRNYHSEFRKQDQYVFVLDKSKRTIVWEPGEKNLSHTSLDKVVDIKGNAFLSTMVDTARSDSIQKVDYWWFSPVTKQVEYRRAYYQLLNDNIVIAVGTFVLEE